MPQSLIIKNGKFTARLYEVSSLLVLPLANIRKLWKLMFDEAWSNAETIATIEDWLPQAARDEDLRHAYLLKQYETASMKMKLKKLMLEGLGTSINTDISRARLRLKQAQEPTDKLRAQAGLCNAMLPKTECQQAVKAVKDLEKSIKAAKRNQDRLEKLQTIFAEMAGKSRI